VTNTNDSGAGSLRQAILNSNSTPGANTIQFAIATSDVQTITPLSILPVITNSVSIDGTTENGFDSNNPHPVVVVNGTSAGFGGGGLTISATQCTVRGLAIDGFNNAGILLYSGSGNLIQGCYLGTSADGSTAVPNTSGITLFNGEKNDTIGGTTAGAGNLISGNSGDGIDIEGSGVSGNLVEGNRIGTTPNGNSALANSGNGMAVYNGATSNTIGGTVAGSGNLISGCQQDGVEISSTGTSNNLVEGNLIGTNTAGTAAVANKSIGVVISMGATNNTVGGTSAGAGNTISGNGNSGVWITSSGTTGNFLLGNRIGTTADGTATLPNGVYGVQVDGGAILNTIGGTVAGAGNTIAGSGASDGIYIGGTGTHCNLIQGNRIGTNASGTVAFPNQNGILITGDGVNTVGGTAAGAGNLIAGNESDGVVILNSTSNLVQGNFIGTTPDGSAAFPNNATGVLISGGTNNTIGGTAVGAGNVISGNTIDGLDLQTSTTTGNLIEGNFIGTNAAGNAAVPNGQGGVTITNGASNNTIGGTTAGAGNTISGNGSGTSSFPGVLIENSGTSGNLIQGNLIGTTADGTGPLANLVAGVEFLQSASNNTIGGTVAGAGNAIADNAGPGVEVISGTGDAILGNSIYANHQALGIDLGGDGVTLNDSKGHTGPNNYQDFPVFTVAMNGNTATLHGTVSGPVSNTLRLEFFANSVPDPSGYGEGQTFLGIQSVPTDSNGNAIFTASFTVPTGQTFLTATATDSAGNTSEFSQAMNVAPASGFFVTGLRSSITAGSTQTFTVTAEDASGYTANGYVGTVHFTSSDAQAGLPADYIFTVVDAGRHTFNATLKTSGNQSITATDTVTASITGSQTTTVTAAAASLVLSGPATATAGTGFNVTVKALDTYGNVATGYLGTVHFTSSDAQALLPADYTFTATDAGKHTFSAILKTAGNESITATDTVTASLTGSQTVTVSAAAMAGFSVSAPTSVTAGVAFSMTVKAVDAYGNLVTGYAGTVHFTSSDTQAVLPANYTYTASDAGKHVFSATLKTAGNQSITATDTVTTSLSGSQTITVSAAAAASLSLTALNSATAGTTFTVTVTARDSYGNVATGYLGTIYFTSSDLQAVLPADYTFTASDFGNHLFAGGVTLKTAGNQSITTADTVNGALTAQATVAVSAAAASQLTLTAPASAVASTSFNVTATVRDAYGNTVTDYTGTVHFTSSDSSAMLAADYQFASGDAGSHTFAVTLVTSGSQTVTVADTVNGALKANATITVVAKGAHIVDLGPTADGYAQDPDSSGVFESVNTTDTEDHVSYLLGTSIGEERGILEFNISGVDSTATIVSATLEGNASLLQWNSQQNMDTVGVYGYVGDGQVTTSDATASTNQVGQYSTTTLGNFDIAISPAFVQSLLGSSTYAGFMLRLLVGQRFFFDSSRNSITSLKPTLHLVFDHPPQAVNDSYMATAGSTLTVTAPGVLANDTDPDGDPLTAVLVSGPAHGTLTLNTNGSFSYTPNAGFLGTDSFTYQANDGYLNSKTATVTLAVNRASAGKFRVSGFPSPVTAGVAGTFTVTALDTNGHVVTSYTGTVHFASSDAPAVLPADYTFTAADAGVHTFTATLKTAGSQSLVATDTVTASITGTQTTSVNPASAANLAVSAPTTATPGVGFSVTVTLTDAYGNVATGYRGTVHFTSSDSQATLPADYTFTSADAGTHTFTATLQTLGTQSITVADTVNAAVKASATFTVSAGELHDVHPSQLQ
jgi:hypothetical protein